MIPGDSTLNAQDYSRLTGFEGDWRDTWWNTDFLELVARRLELSKCRRVLDLGCGAGHWGRALSQVLPTGVKVIGVDPEESFLQAARQQAPQGFEYQAGVAEKIPLEDESMDLVTCQTLLIHVPDASAALGEMLRVLKPGGLILAAEPNNVASSYTLLGGHPDMGWERYESWIRFQFLCERGKRSLGEGDQSVGERLPGIFASLGLESVQVCLNEKTPALYPPYASRDQQVEVKQLLEWLSEEEWLQFGTQDNARRYFLAGGGSETDFSLHWDRAMEVQRDLRTALIEGTFHGGRCPNFYLVSGRKPKLKTMS